MSSTKSRISLCVSPRLSLRRAVFAVYLAPVIVGLGPELYEQDKIYSFAFVCVTAAAGG